MRTKFATSWIDIGMGSQDLILTASSLTLWPLLKFLNEYVEKANKRNQYIVSIIRMLL